MAVVHLTLDGAKVSAMRLEEHARAIRLVPKYGRFTVRQVVDRLEEAVDRRIVIDAKMAPGNRSLERAMQRGFDWNRPARRAAHPRMAAAIAGMESEDVGGQS
jgi:hypothetical protein